MAFVFEVALFFLMISTGFAFYKKEVLNMLNGILTP
jgi:hypothetical protein